jgi:hypothetical protein
MTCRCEVRSSIRSDDELSSMRPYVVRCPLHAVAPEMLAFIQDYVAQTVCTSTSKDAPAVCSCRHCIGKRLVQIANREELGRPNTKVS